jgi:hypothetical protein
LSGNDGDEFKIRGDEQVRHRGRAVVASVGQKQLYLDRAVLDRDSVTGPGMLC